jgi:hypothetical protein
MSIAKIHKVVHGKNFALYFPQNLSFPFKVPCLVEITVEDKLLKISEAHRKNDET